MKWDERKRIDIVNDNRLIFIIEAFSVKVYVSMPILSLIWPPMGLCGGGIPIRRMEELRIHFGMIVETLLNSSMNTEHNSGAMYSVTQE